MSDQSNDRAPCFAVENGSYGTYDPRMPQRKVRIKIEHRIEYPDPLRVAAGERVNVGHEDAEFPGWKWCKASDGREGWVPVELDRKSTRLNSSHRTISYAVFCLK